MTTSPPARPTARMGRGLAFNADADLAMFREMAAGGQRLVGTDAVGR